jgi:hypothetical protein
MFPPEKAPFVVEPIGADYIGKRRCAALHCACKRSVLHALFSCQGLSDT